MSLQRCRKMSAPPFPPAEHPPTTLALLWRHGASAPRNCLESGWASAPVVSAQAILIIGPAGHFRHRRTHPTTFLVLILQLVELVINPPLRQQLLVRSHLAHLAFMHDDDLVR